MTATETIVIRIDDKFMAWTDGYISGDKELVKEARLLSRLRVLMYMPMAVVECNLDDPSNPAGAIAAMWGVHPGRAFILEGYPEVVVSMLGGVEPDPGR